MLISLISLKLIGCNSFPNVDEIDNILALYHQKELQEERVQIIGRLLQGISRPNSVEDDRLISYTMQQLVDVYKDRNDIAILIALDGTRIDVGVRPLLCN